MLSWTRSGLLSDAAVTAAAGRNWAWERAAGARSGSKVNGKTRLALCGFCSPAEICRTAVPAGHGALEYLQHLHLPLWNLLCFPFRLDAAVDFFLYHEGTSA